jgi:hypothetical protein
MKWFVIAKARKKLVDCQMLRGMMEARGGEGGGGESEKEKSHDAAEAWNAGEEEADFFFF